MFQPADLTLIRLLFREFINRIRARTHQPGSLGSPPLGSHIGGISVLERAWIKSLGNAFHVARNRGPHREGTHCLGVVSVGMDDYPANLM
jgi:hypothetical protein